MTELEQIDIEKRLAVLEAELELARRVADAALAVEMLDNAFLRLPGVVGNETAKLLFQAEYDARDAFKDAVRAYRARVEAVAFMAQPAVRRGLEGCGEMEAED